MRVLALAALVLASALAPLASAHIDNPPPRVQPFQFPRDVDLALNGTRATADLYLAGDPFRHLVRHVVDPAASLVSAEYRRIPSSTQEETFGIEVELTRFLEYRDVNGNLQYERVADVLVREWSFERAAWRASGPRELAIGNVPVHTANWTLASGGGPRLELLASFAGRAVSDEGATAFPQDGILYLDVLGLPPRGTGHYYALEGRVRATTDVALDVSATEVPTAFVAGDERHLAFFQWGGEAVVDGRERALTATLDEPGEEGWRAFGLHFPLMDRSARLVIVSGAEYVAEDKREPAPGLLLVVGVIAVVALARAARLRGS